MIALSDSDKQAFVYIPHSFNVPYLEEALSHALNKDIAIAGCRTTNLCAWNDWGVSNSGATVLRLGLDLKDGRSLDVKAKILSPDVVNVFGPDCRFDARLSEIAWAKWWGEQGVSFVPTIYDTRVNCTTREFWILEEYFTQVGWHGFTSDAPKGMGHFSTGLNTLKTLFEHVATLHAYSHKQSAALLERFSGSTIRPGHLCTPAMLVDALSNVVDDAQFLADHDITGAECRSLASYAETVAQRPGWVDAWDIVCVTADWGPDNFGIRESGKADELVNFDWGTTRLAPMEEDLDVLLMRLVDVDREAKQRLVQHYLRIYGEQTGHQIDAQIFTARIPWARFLVTLRYIAGHVNNLLWVGYQSRSEDMLHLFIGLCEKFQRDCQPQ